MPQHTPWGAIQDSYQIADGLTFYSTSSHGGIHLSEDRWRELKTLLPDLKPWAGDYWLEEDCDYSYAMFCWPELWEDDYGMFLLLGEVNTKRLKAVNTSQECLKRIRIIAERSERWRKANGENWMRGSSSAGGQMPRGIWCVWFTRVCDREKRTVYMPYPEKNIYTTEELDEFDAQHAELLQTAETDF